MSTSPSQLTAVAAAAADLIEVSRLSATIVYTANTISAQASDNSLNDSAAQFLVEGWFTVGRRFKIAGFTGDVGNNADVVEVVSVAAGKVVIAGVTLVDDAEGESVTLTAWESFSTSAQDVADLAATSGPSVASRYVIDLASQSDGDPGSGKLRFNHATPTSATKIFLDDETSDGVDLSTKLLDLGSSGYIRIQSAGDVGEWLYAKWTAITDDTGYFDIAITVLASKGTLDDTDAVLVTFDAKGSGGGGSTQGLHDIWIAAGSWYADYTAPPEWGSVNGASDQPDYAYWTFDPTTEKAVWTVLRLPKSWNGGTITFQPSWWHQSTTTNFGIAWSMRAVAIGNDDALAVSYGTAQTSIDTGGTTADVYTGPESSAITIAGTPAAGDLVFLELRRLPADGSDNLAVAAGLLGARIQITTNADTDA
jgi:hypothetical protein